MGISVCSCRLLCTLYTTSHERKPVFCCWDPSSPVLPIWRFVSLFQPVLMVGTIHFFEDVESIKYAKIFMLDGYRLKHDHCRMRSNLNNFIPHDDFLKNKCEVIILISIQSLVLFDRHPCCSQCRLNYEQFQSFQWISKDSQIEYWTVH